MAFIILTLSWIFMFLNIISVLIMVFLERKDIRSIQSWVLLFLILPPGFSLYIYFIFGRGPKINNKKIEKRNQKLLNELNVFLSSEQYLEILNNNTVDNSILRFNFFHNKSLITKYNNVKILNTAYEKYNELLQDIRNAKHSIHMLYYIIKNDTIGNIVLNALCEKAKEGVKIRLIYDDVGCMNVPRKFFNKLKEYGAEVYSFFPSYVKFINLNINYRNHRKIIIIDGNVGYLGGMNIGDEYMSLNPKLKPWKDCHLKIEGEAVNSLQLQFIEDLSYLTNHKIEKEKNFKEKYFYTKKTNEVTYTQIVASGPDHKNYEKIKAAYLKMLYSAKKEIYIQTPYLALDDGFLAALISTAQSGIKVRIMIPYIYDKKIVYRVTSSYINEFIKRGIEVYLYKGFIHSKVMIMDDCVTSIGSANFNVRSFSLNFEINAFITDCKTAHKMKEIFNEDMKNSILVDKSYIDNKSMYVKFEEGLSRLFTPLF